MKNKLFGTPKLRFLYSFLFFQLALYTLYRLSFLLYFRNDVAEGTADLVLKNLWLGFRFDLRFAMIMIAPAIIFINLPLNRAFQVRFANVLYGLFLAAINLLYIIDAGYFSYLKSRLNATALQFLKNPIISFQMVRESYPWPLLLIVFLALTALTIFIFTKFISPKLIGSPFVSNKRTGFLGPFVFTLLFAFSIYGSTKMYPLRWSEAFATPDAFSSNLSLNPLLYAADTYSFTDTEFEKQKVHQYYPMVAQYLGVESLDEKNLDFIRSFPGDPLKRAVQPNIVVIVMESLAYFKTGLGGSEVNPTPYLDALARESLLFTHFYTPTVATARSIFAAVTSLPDTSRVKTGSRNPFIVNQHTIISEFKDYDKFYFLGGSANWGNIRGVFTYNIPQLTIFEEGSYRSPRVDVWGISDLNLFKEAREKINTTIKENQKPFFAFIQSSGFHRPYTVPLDSDDFLIKTPKDISEETIKSFGFESYEEYNAMRLQDFSLGKFMEMAKKESWYSNTIFVIFGDHALPHNNAKNVPEWQKSMANSFHVPLLIHAPGKIPAGVENKIASELDVMPTIAGLAGIPYKTRSLGRDLFDPRYDNSRMAFSYNWFSPFNLSLIDKDFYFEYLPSREKGKLVKYGEHPDGMDVKDQYPDKYKEMETLTKGLYETAKYLLHNNPKIL